MRPSNSELSDASTPPPRLRRRLRHRRRSPPSPNESIYEEEEDPYITHTNEEEDGDLHDVDGIQRNSYTDSLSSTAYSVAQSYINVAPLPIFRGAPDECPVAHLSRFERVCRANNATSLETVVRIFPVTLDGEAALWFELAVEPNVDMQWDEIKSEFLQAYRAPDFADRARAELIGLRQREGEGVNAYHLRLRWILKKWPDHGMPDKVLMGIFTDGLREDFQDWVVPQRPETLDEAVKLAAGWERAQSARAARQRTCGFCKGGHDESTCAVRKKMRELWLKSCGEESANGGIDAPAAEEKAAEGGEKELGRVVSMGRRSQCICWKHQCWKKLERSSSIISSVPPNPTTPRNNISNNPE